MREIIFRGKRVDGKGWIYGDYTQYPSIGIREGGAFFDVRPDTIGQFTGILDKNGKRIFEGDFVRILYTDWPSKSDSDPRTLDQYLTDISSIGFIEFHYDRWCVNFGEDEKYGDVSRSSIYCGKYGFIEIVT